jgi:hypothetical protein
MLHKQPESSPEQEKRTGHRGGPQKSNEPRDLTVCCLVSKSEREIIDELSEKFGYTRSAYIVQWVAGLVEAVTAESADYKKAREKLDDFLDRSRQKWEAHRQEPSTRGHRISVIKK